MKTLIGLGNFGKKYRLTRHNLGQLIIQKLGEKYKLKFKNFPKANCQIAQYNTTIFATTKTYMNLSGPAVKSLISFYKTPLKDLYIIHDDLDLPIGEYRIQFGRGAAGHNGIKSIIESINSQSFYRIRVGIGRPIISAMSVNDFVLSPFNTTEKIQFDEIIDKIIKEITKIIDNT